MRILTIHTGITFCVTFLVLFLDGHYELSINRAKCFELKESIIMSTVIKIEN